MENFGVPPDIRVDNSPEDNLAGRDRQLEAAVEELMKQLGGGRRNQTTTNNQ
jgi:tricorn protease